MRMINKVLIGLTVSGAAFATVGSGAGASFIDSPSVHQEVDTGTLLVDLSTGAANGPVATATTSVPASLTLPTISPLGSSFMVANDIVATNNGTIPGTITDVELSTLAPVSKLAKDATITIWADDFAHELCSNTVANCSHVNLATAANAAGIALAPGKSYTFHIHTYAGAANYANELTNADEGQSIVENLKYTVTG